MSIEAVMNGFTSWQKQFEGEVNLVVKTNAKTLAEGVEILKENVEKRTPVGRPELWKYPAHKDYLPGTLKNSWELSKLSDLYYTLYNDVPYAYRVETGWSSQAPYGMMRVSLKEWESIINKIAKKNEL